MAHVQRSIGSDNRRFRFASPHGLLYAVVISAALWAVLAILLASTI